MRALAVVLVSLLCGPGFGCKKAGKRAGAGGGGGSAAVDAAAGAPVGVTPAVDAAAAAAAAPCAGMWAHSDPDFCLALTGPASYSIELQRTPRPAGVGGSQASLQVLADTQYDQLLESMAEAAGERGARLVEDGELPAGKWMSWIEPPANGSPSRFRSVVRFGGHAYQCEVYWQPRSKREPMLDEQGHDRSANIEFCKSLTELPAGGCPAGQWAQPDPGFCARKPAPLSAWYQIHFPQTFKGMHLNVYEDDSAHDAQLARLERDSAPGKDNEFIAKGELPGGQWRQWRSLYEGETLEYQLRTVQRLGGRTYECYVKWPLIAQGKAVPIALDDPQLIAAIMACKSLRAP